MTHTRDTGSSSVKGRRHVCTHCGVDTENIYNLCDSCLSAWVAESCEAQGVPFKVEDPETLRKIAILMRPALEKAAS